MALEAVIRAGDSDLPVARPLQGFAIFCTRQVERRCVSEEIQDRHLKFADVDVCIQRLFTVFEHADADVANDLRRRLRRQKSRRHSSAHAVAEQIDSRDTLFFPQELLIGSDVRGGKAHTEERWTC